MKDSILQKLGIALEDGLVDEEVIPLISSINRIPGAVTTSSCSGRIQLIQVPRLGDKLGSNILGKWHRTVEPKEVLRALEEWDGDGQLHLLVQPLLLHIRCRDLLTAGKLRNLAHGAGLKFSTIRSVKVDEAGLKEWGAVVEFLGTERMEVPLHCIQREMFDEIIPPLLNHGNGLLSRTKAHINEIKDIIDDEYPYKG